MTWTERDYFYMSRAIQLARRGRYTTDPNPRVGCVLVSGNSIAAEGWHQQAGGPHAEIHALNQIANVTGAVCYVTLEPCSHHGRTPPCVDALIDAKISKVNIAMVDPNPEVSGQGMEKLNQVNIETACGLMEQEARALNPGYIRRMETGQPFVRCKLAMSLDGRTALANGESQWITSAEARRDVHRLRAGSSAIITGAGTVLADDPSMTVRDFTEDYQQPIRVIIDVRLEIPVTARMLTLEGRTLIMTQSVDEGKKLALTQAGAEVVVLAKSDKGTWLKSVLQYLAEKEQVNEIILESGASLSGSFIQAGLVDEMIIYMAAKLLGSDARPLLQLKQFEQLPDCPELNIIDVRNIGHDIRIQVSLDKD